MLTVYEQIHKRWGMSDAAARGGRSQEDLFTRARKVEKKYAIALRKIASHVGHIIEAFPTGDPAVLPQLNQALRRYSDILGPWANNVARMMLLEVNHWDKRAWQQHSANMSTAIREQIERMDVGLVFRRLQAEQVDLIKSIPLRAAQRVHDLTEEILADSNRASSLVDDIMRSGHVARSHATLIALTEVSRATTSFTQARATNLGGTHYVWETAKDSRVRSEHRALQGKVFSWDDPPIAGSKGERAHPGCIYRCRCWPRVIFND
jgi:SPP1 gp7 family putative phage head morphogenesis protein